MAKAKAYSYLRFSTPDQLRGDSFRRQSEASESYAAQHSLDLDTTLTFRDLGVSAFRGKNAREGALADFIQAVEQGRIAAGSFLLVESLDRLSRQAVNRAYLQFQSIVDHGINVVTLQDGKVYTRESLTENFGDLMFSLAIMFRANEESATKSKRLRAAWGNKRKRAAKGAHKLTSICPAWLTLDRTAGNFVVNKQRAKVVQRIFALTLSGHGKATIAQTFNRESVPTFGRSDGWHPSYVQKILDSEAVFGVFQPMRLEIAEGKRERVADGEPVAGYFPPVVDRDTFLQAQRLRRGRKIEGGRKGENFSNLFTGIAKCGGCGAPMHYINKGAGSKGGKYLACSNARRAASNCGNRPWRYGNAEKFILIGLSEVNYAELFPKGHKNGRERLEQLERRRLGKQADLAKAQKQADNIVSLLAERPDSAAYKGKLVSLEKTIDALAAEVSALGQEVDTEADRLATIERDHKETQDTLQQLAKGMRRENGAAFDLRSRLHQLLKRTLEQIEFTPAAPAALKHDTIHGDIVIAFAGNDSYRRVLRVEAGQGRCEGFKIVDGKRDRSGPHIEIFRGRPQP